MALWPGLSSVSISLQQGQRASSLMSDQRRSVSRAGKRAECNGFRLHRLSTESWRGERNAVVTLQTAGIQCKCSGKVFLRWRPLWSWIKSEMPEGSIKKNNYAAKLSRTSHLKSNSHILMTKRCIVAPHNFFEKKTKGWFWQFKPFSNNAARYHKTVELKKRRKGHKKEGKWWETSWWRKPPSLLTWAGEYVWSPGRDRTSCSSCEGRGSRKEAPNWGSRPARSDRSEGFVLLMFSSAGAAWINQDDSYRVHETQLNTAGQAETSSNPRRQIVCFVPLTLPLASMRPLDIHWDSCCHKAEDTAESWRYKPKSAGSM